MPYEERFTDAEFVRIVEEGLIYMCACPAQVAEAMRKLRELESN
jgi:glutamyl/glutaminyl-tRNA synthetase